MLDPLLAQLIQRTLKFKERTGLSSRQISKLTGIGEQHLCDFLGGRRGLSTRSTMRLLQTVNSSKAQLEQKFNTKVTRIEHFQQNGEAAMTLSYGGSVAGTGPDPNDGDITSVNTNPARSVPDAAELEFLAGLAGLHQQIIDKINNWQGQQKARPNPSGSTGSTRQITRPKTPGPISPDFI